MALLTPSKPVDKSKGKIEIATPTLNKIYHYCEFAGISVNKDTGDISEFVEKVMEELIDTKDKDWKQFKKENATLFQAEA